MLFIYYYLFIQQSVASVTSADPHRFAAETDTMRSAQKTSENGQNRPELMTAWQMNSYGTYEDLTLNAGARSPAIGPKEVLVRVKASSVNPIDVLMAGKSR